MKRLFCIDLMDNGYVLHILKEDKEIVFQEIDNDTTPDGYYLISAHQQLIDTISDLLVAEKAPRACSILRKNKS